MIVRYKTLNSLYEVDEDAGLYRRTTLNPYQAPEIRNPQGSPNMVEGEWLNLDTVNPNPVTIVYEWGEPCLNIRYYGCRVGLITSPLVSIDGTPVRSLDVSVALHGTEPCDRGCK